ncbi:helix-turn-helix domain-containing protein [Chitinophaga sp. LS1]|uniref:helix-turn-helix domain-containing protein n=1 Tax=Chitinophaga sp. LS1 TaxID=3051176 RepID=UPI0039EE40D1
MYKLYIRLPSMKSKVDILKVFGENLKALRQAKDLTQMDVAIALNSTPGYVSRLENGHNEPGLTVIYMLSEALECTPSDLLPILPHK